MNIPFVKSEADKKLAEYQKLIEEQKSFISAKESEQESINQESLALKEQTEHNRIERQKAEEKLRKLQREAGVVAGEAQLERKHREARARHDRINVLSCELYALLNEMWDDAKKDGDHITLNNNYRLRREYSRQAEVPKNVEIYDGFQQAINNLQFISHSVGNKPITIWSYSRGKDSQWLRDLIKEHG